MVKADYTRDYYADLELSPSCSNDDIKRQFRKLALLYHPDRNPGKELEYSPRFQAIQAAHEVLGDPDERTRYDASRRRGTVNNTFARPAPPRRNNPYQAHSDFPPPPRRAPNHRTTTEPSSTTKPNTSSKGGAERYTRWTGPPPPQRANQSTAQEARDKANAFSAWQAMNSAPKGQPPPRYNQPPPFPPRRPPPSAPESSGGPSARPRNPSPPRSAYEEVHGPPSGGSYQTAPGYAPRRTGFDPKTPDGDERPVSGPSMYGSAPRYDRENPPPMASGVPPTFSQHPPHAPTPPPRGAAPTAKRADHPGPFFRTTSRDDIPFAEGSAKVKTPYPANVGEKTYVNPEKLQRANSYREPPNLRRPVSEFRPQPGHMPNYERRRSAGGHEQTNGNTAHQQQFSEKHRPTMYYSSSEESSDEDTPPPTWANSSKDRTSSGASQNSSSSNIPDRQRQNRPKAQPKSRTKPNVEPRMYYDGHAQNTEKPPGHAFPGKSDTFARTSNPELRGSQFDHDDANFSPTDTTGFATNIPRTESHPNMFAFRGQNEEPRPPPDPPRSSGEPGQNYFAADKWTRDLQEENWAATWGPNTSAPQTSPTKSAPNSRRPRGSSSHTTTRSNTAKTPANPQPASVEEEESGDPATFNVGQRAESPDSSNAMDIDTEPPHAERKPSIVVNDTDQPDQQPRAVHVEPSRPEWRDHPSTNGNAFNRRPSLPGDFSIPSKDMPSNRAQGSRLSSQLSMDDFRHVAPFTKPTASGLRDMNDIAADLPFQSKPSTANPLNSSVDPQAELPRPPRPPAQPPKWNQHNWLLYIENMSAYLSAWHDFKTQMLLHFQNRSRELENFEKNVTRAGGGAGVPVKDGGTGVVQGWLGARGETRELRGWDTYVAGMKDDERWRTHWNVACDKHAAAIEAHAILRERIQRGEIAT